MSAAERMRDVLNDTGIYALTGSTSADWEINAAAAGIDFIDSEIEKLLNELFTLTSSEERLNGVERLFRPEILECSPELRRQCVYRCVSMNPRQYTAADMNEHLKAAGIIGEAVEDGNSLTVYIGMRLGLTDDEINKELDRVLPAHIQWTREEVMNWVALNAYARGFEDIDSLGLTWDDFDSMTLDELRNIYEEAE